MKLKSSLTEDSADAQDRVAAHLAALEPIVLAAQNAAQGGGERSRDRHVSRGKMLPRDRVANLLDPGSSFLEIGATAAHDMYEGAAPGAG